MSSLSRELVFLILQFLDEEKFKETVHKLEQESGFFFNMKYFEDQVLGGEWEEVERYLSGFTKVDDNRYSMKIFFEIRKQKYLEALDKQDRGNAVDILVKDLKVFASFNEELYKEITQLLTLDNFRENEQLSKYGDTKSARNIMLLELKKLIEANPLFRDKLNFPGLKLSRLRTLINQSLNWQHQLCKNPRPNPDIKTLFVDHTCGPPTSGRAAGPIPSSGILAGGPKPQGGSFPLGVHSQMAQGAAAAAGLAGWMGGYTNAQPSHASMAAQAGLSAPPVQDAWPGHQGAAAAQLSKRARTPPAPSESTYPMNETEHIVKRPRQMVDEVAYTTSTSQQQQERSYTVEDIPQNVARTLSQGSQVISMDFHPTLTTVLAVGTSTGDVAVWDVGHGDKLVETAFKLWNHHDSQMLHSALQKEPGMSVRRVIWSTGSEASLLGVAFSKHIVHIYAYTPSKDLRQHLEIDAHNGSVNDLAFSHPNKQLCVITCGEDKTIRVWDATSGRKLYTFDGHEAAVYSVCPHHKENIQFVFSTAVDGKIKAWLYDNLGSRVDYDAPGKWCTTMAYSADGTRLFSCGTSQEGETSLVEWNESEGAIKRTYNGFWKRSSGVVQFDTIRNRFLAAGDEFVIKIWNMDATSPLMSINADGGLPASPRLRFNKEGSLLAVTTQDNGIKILANNDGLNILFAIEAAGRTSQQPDLKQEPSSTTSPGAAAAAQNSGVGVTAGERLERTPSSAALQGVNGMDTNQKPKEARVEVELPRPRSDGLPTSNITSTNITSNPATNNTNTSNTVSNNNNTTTTANANASNNYNNAASIKASGPSSSSSKMIEIDAPHQCATSRLPDPLPPGGNGGGGGGGGNSNNKVARLLYTYSGMSVLMLGTNAVHKLWKWPRDTKASALHQPALYQPAGPMMINDHSEQQQNSSTNVDDSIHCIALSKNDSYVMSASGGKISLFNMYTFKVMTTFMPPPPAATCLAFHPQDNNIIAIGMEDSHIQIYNVRLDEAKSKLKGHQKRVTGLAFSSTLGVLVSAGQDAQLFVWATGTWERRLSRGLTVANNEPAAPAHTGVQFHNDQYHVLVTHDSQIAIYLASKLERLRQWLVRDNGPLITCASYSCDSSLVIAGFTDGSTTIFDAETLQPRVRIALSTYAPTQPSSIPLYPCAVAPHPSEPNQFCLGLSDGGVQIFEPLDPDSKWGIVTAGESGNSGNNSAQMGTGGVTEQ